MKVLLFGSRGFLGQEFLKMYPGACCPSLNIADGGRVGECLERERPDVVINAAGKTGQPNIDWCESHKIETIQSNVTGPLILLQECMRRGIYWVHLSSGCIYEGSKSSLPLGGRVRERGSKKRELDDGFTEEDPPNFSGSFYSRSKACIDQVLQEFPVLLLRLRMPFDASMHDRNLIMKLRRYAKVLDAPNSLTYLPDFLLAASTLIERRRTGVFNVVNPGSMSPYEIMRMYKKIVQSDHSFEGIGINDLSTLVRAGRSNCILSTAKLQGEGIHLPDVHQRMEEALQSIKASLVGEPLKNAKASW